MRRRRRRRRGFLHGHFIFPGRSKNTVSIDAESVSNSATEEASIRSFSVLGQQDNGEDNKGVYDLTSSIGREEYLQAVQTVRITQRSPEGGQFRHRLDGTRHNWIPVKKEDHCQWCYYHLMNVVSDEDRRHFTKSLRQVECSDVWSAM